MNGLSERTKRQIALLAGDDLEGELRDETRQSVESCCDCRGHLLRLRGCLDVLDRVSRTTDARHESSLWPAIESRLRPSATVRRGESFNGWVPALSMAAACIALLIAGRMDGIAPQDAAANGHDAVQAGMFPAGHRLHGRPFGASDGLKRRFDRFQQSVSLPTVEVSAYDPGRVKQDVLRLPFGRP